MFFPKNLAMSNLERPFASYHLWSLVVPNQGQQHWHCQMRRGFMKARQNEPEVQALRSQITAAQQIGLLAQQGVYEFHRNRDLFVVADGVERVASILELDGLSVQVRTRVLNILHRYYTKPILRRKRILLMTRGDEGFPKPIWIIRKNYRFRLYAMMDCVVMEPDNTLHILDFKTGKSPFDQRQALVYLLAARYLYPGYRMIASFYNLENSHKSEVIRVTNRELDQVEGELALIATKHYQDVQKYKNSGQFSQIFPPNPGKHCRYCPFHRICEFAQLD